MLFAVAKLTEVDGNLTYEGGEYFNTDHDITEVPTDIPEETTRVVLWNNIKDIRPGAFSHLSNCTDLVVYSNKLETIRADMWVGLGSLDMLNLGDIVKLALHRQGMFFRLKFSSLNLISIS